jgi:hypothetical protein
MWLSKVARGLLAGRIDTMNRTTLAILLAALVAAASAATFVVVQQPQTAAHHHGAGADEHALHGGVAGDGPHAQLGMERPRFPQATGSVPTPEQAQRLPQARHVHIMSDDDFDEDHFVKSGSGTLEDPYVITGLFVKGSFRIADTSKCFVVTGNWFDGHLILDWNGPCAWVHHNYIRDLRVNQNVHRTGHPTGGLLELNKVNYVGQIRHFDGEFRHNVVGPREDHLLPSGIFDDLENLIPFFKDTRVLNVDGFNQGLFHHNTVFGSVDLKLHGHHHGTGFLASHSHYHGDGKAKHKEDHTDRWSSVVFSDNKVVDPEGYGLRYVDEMHAGDDRRAPSETHEALERPHVHHTLVEIRRNVLEGAGIWVDVFNADDRRHLGVNPGWFYITDNQVDLVEREEGLLGEQFFGPWYQPNTAIWVWQSKEAQFFITGNTMTFKAKPQASPLDPLKDLQPQWMRWGPDERPIAVSIDGARDAAYTVSGNKAVGFEFGLKGANMQEDAFWADYGNQWGAKVLVEPSVANEPSKEPLPPGPGPYDEQPEHH